MGISGALELYKNLWPGSSRWPAAHFGQGRQGGDAMVQVTFEDTPCTRSGVAAAVVAGVVLSVKIYEGSTEKLDGALAAFCHTASVFRIPWAYIVEGAREQLGDGLAGLLEG